MRPIDSARFGNEDSDFMPKPIPRRIIQTGRVFPQSVRLRGMISNLRLLNPDFDYMFFDNHAVEDFIDQEFPKYRQIFDSFKFPIQRYDFFRYLAVYRYGGFYFDTDVLLAAGLSGLLEFGCVFPYEGLTLSRYLRRRYHVDWEIGNYGFGATAGHPFLEAVIENCVRGHKDPAWVRPMLQGLPMLTRSEFYVLASTGPGLVTRTLAENDKLASTVRVLFTENVLDLSQWNHFGDVGIHAMDGTWRAKGNLVIRTLRRMSYRRKLAAAVRESSLLGKTRRQPFSYSDDHDTPVSLAVHSEPNAEGNNHR
jgi:hypothetical protein